MKLDNGSTASACDSSGKTIFVLIKHIFYPGGFRKAGPFSSGHSASKVPDDQIPQYSFWRLPGTLQGTNASWKWKYKRYH